MVAPISNLRSWPIEEPRPPIESKFIESKIQFQTRTKDKTNLTLSLSLSLPFPGLQWTVVDSNYSRFSMPAACQSNLIGNGNGGNQNSGASSSAGVGAAATNDQRQQQQQHEAQQQATQQQQQQHLQQLHYQQQQQQQQGTTAGQAYSSQIITVNNLVSGYATTAQNLSPTSPNESNMVQSVYSQGPTPTQSPVHSGVGGGGGSSAGGSAGSAGGGGGGNSSSGAGGGGSQVVKRKRSVNPQGDENFIQALEAVRTGGIGFCKAARLYGVNNRTLWLEYKKRGYPVSRPSIKARVVKQEPNLSPSPTPSTNPGDDTTNENYDHLTAAAVAAAQTAALNMQIPPQTETPTPSLMCTPHHTGTAGASSTGGTNTHPTIGVMSLFDARYMDSPTSVHTMSRQRYIDATGAGTATAASSAGTINVNPAAMNLQSINFNSI